MKLLGKKLQREGFSIFAPQLAGHGADRAALLRTTWRDWLDSVRVAYERYKSEVDEMYVAGICVGGELGLLLAHERPEIKAAGIYSMTFVYDGWNMQSWYAKVAPAMRHIANLPGIRDLSFQEPYPFGLKDERLRAMVSDAQNSLIPGALDRLPLGSMYEMYCLSLHLEKLGPRIEAPTLLVHAREDDMSDPKNSYRLQRALGGPTELHLLEDSYHMIHVDRERDAVAAITAKFFNGVSARQAFAMAHADA
jgi:carboxylesterase